MFASVSHNTMGYSHSFLSEDNSLLTKLHAFNYTHAHTIYSEFQIECGNSYTSLGVSIWLGDHKCPQVRVHLSVLTSSNFFFTNLYTILSLIPNLQCTVNHFSIKPHLLSLIETRVSDRTENGPFSIPSYFSLSSFSIQSCMLYLCAHWLNLLSCPHSWVF